MLVLSNFLNLFKIIMWGIEISKIQKLIKDIDSTIFYVNRALPFKAYTKNLFL